MQQRYYTSGGLGGMMTPGIKGLLIANIAVFLLQGLNDRELVYLFGLTPAAFWQEFAVWQPVTYMFLHGGFTHILFNMLALWMFGSTLEATWGTKPFLKYYFLTGIGAGLCNTLLTPNMDSVIIGASGAVYGILMAYALIFPNSLIYIWGLVPVRAKWLVLGFGLLEFLSSLSPGTSPIAHIVHLGGMLIGLIYLRKDQMLRAVARKIKSKQREREVVIHHKQMQAEDDLRQEVDDLLDKINQVGLDNLTSWERKRLREASEMLKQMEEREG
ncbi:rhomboid family intramembrane serine protease [Calditrichota bacterium]